LKQLLLARQVLARYLQRGAGGLDLRVAGGGVLIGSAGIDAQQQLPGLDPVADLGIQLHHGAWHLGCDHGLAHGLDHAVKGRGGGAGGGLRRHGFERLGLGRGWQAAQQGSGQRGRGETDREHGACFLQEAGLARGQEGLD
jgi:hypothetical protein